MFGITSGTLVRSSPPPGCRGPPPGCRGRRAVWNHFQYSCPIVSGTIHGPVRRRPDGCGLGRGLLDRADNITAARERSESLLGYSGVITHMHTSHAPPPGLFRARIVWRN